MEAQPVPKIIPQQLQIAQAGELDVEYPVTTYYQGLVPTSHTQRQSVWDVLSPGPGYLLDAFATIRYRLKISAKDPANNIGKMFSNQLDATVTTGNPQGTALEAKFALRSNFAMTRCIYNTILVINGATINVRPNEIIDVMNRMYLSHEDSKTYATMSAGYYDDCSYTNICQDMECSITGNGGQGPSTNVGLRDNPGFLVDYTDIGNGILDPPNNATDNWRANTGASLQLGIGTRGKYCWQEASGPRYTMPMHNISSAAENTGWKMRLEQMYNEWRKHRSPIYGLHNAKTAPNVNADYANNGGAVEVVNGNHLDYIMLELSEPIFCSPFAFYPSQGTEKSIPHVKTMQLTNTYVSDIPSMLFNFYGGMTAEAANPAKFEETLQVFIEKDPKLHLRWYRPAMPLPPQVALRHEYIQTFTNSFDFTPDNISVTTNVVDDITMAGIQKSNWTFNGIHLNGIPDYLMLYFRKDQHQIDSIDPTDCNLGIESLRMSIDGVSGRVLQANSAQLYRMYLANAPRGTRSTYIEWKTRHCCLILSPTDYGLQDQASTMSKRTVTLNIDDIQWVNYWAHAKEGYCKPTRDAGNWRFSRAGTIVKMNFYVQAVYRDKRLILTEGGQGALKL